ncbi:DUF423 domain-containing protein [Shewanella algae]|uniref:DUF423 domain-containing protein n=1 Tax=Shewanella algae TaxID=38313 RepID=UPI00046809B3|nr:DUF423 domain-containing protein [Shewanella algae]NKZ43133.1 DUF423 domain-containing protein [Shewanella algae]QTE76847.1 DUF423 domain-containing protein [Shewanella algae]
MRKGLLLLAAISGFFAVAMGAFGAHGLKTIAPAELIAIFNLGVEYQFYHTFGLITLAFAGHWFKSRLIDWAAGLFIAGIFMFSGSLYLYALTGTKWLGMVTPLGGSCFLVGWLLLAAAVWRHRMDETGL